MANEMQRGNLTGTAVMRIPISGTVNISGKQMKELRFMPYSEFPEEGREDVLYIDTDGNAMYYWDGTEYIALSGGGSGGTSNYNELSNKPSINDITLTGNKTSADLGLQPTISDLATIRSGAASGATAVQPSDMESALSEKQDTISDLQTIRSGAALGATAVQPSDMETALASKQDVIDDLSDIRTGAAAGETAVQPSALETALSEKQDVISDLADIRSGASAGVTALQPEDVDTLPTDGSSNPVSSGGTYNFVNSSIATNTAYFIGTFASVAELEAYSGTVTNNDYAFVTSTDSAGNTLYNRYKYNAATQTWSFEYAVNNTAFTTAQWAAIQSGMTPADKTKLDGIETGANKTVIDASPTSGSGNAVSSGGVHTALSGKQDTIADLSDIRSGASAGATAVQPAALSDYQTKLSGTNKLDPSYIDYDASHRAVTDTEKSTWNSKQDTISDLSTIRSGAAAGATALQQSDVTSTYSASGTAPVNGTAVNAAIGTLDVSSVGGSGKYISAISETNGKISATPTTFDTVLSSSSTDNNAPTSKAVYDDQQRQDAEIAVIGNAGAKNLLPDKHAAGNAVETNGFRFTPQSDGGIKIESIGTHSANGDYYIQGNWGNTVTVLDLSDDTYAATISCETTVSGISLRIFGASSIPIVNNIYLNNETNFTGEVKFIFITVISTAVIPSSGIIVYPMIRPASITDSTFVPYAKTNRELTVAEDEDRAALIQQVDGGAKNLIDASGFTPQTKNGITLTKNADDSFTITGTFTSHQTAFFTIDNIVGTAGTVLAFEGGENGIYAYARNGNPSEWRTTSDGVPIPSQNVGAQFGIAIMVNNQDSIFDGRTFNKTVRIMICTAADWAVSQKFVPYAPTNRELYEMIQALQNNS